jgi:hypothetical protein
LSSERIEIKFQTPHNGKIEIRVHVRDASGLNHSRVQFELDTGSRFTIISQDDLKALGYTPEILAKCPKATNAFGKEIMGISATGYEFDLKYIPSMSLMFNDRELID